MRLGVGDDLVEGGEHDLFPAAFDELAHPLFGDAVGRYLGAEVPAPDLGVRTLARMKSRMSSTYRPDQPERRDDDALLVDLARVAGHRAGAHPAHVGVVRPRDRVADDLAFRGHRRDERYVRQVRAPE